MAIIVENGTAVSGANSYVSTAELSAYAAARGVTLTLGAETLLIQAMDYIESLSFVGIKWTRDQALQWPRLSVIVDGYTLDVSTIPQQLKNGQMAAALAIDAGNGPLIDLPKNTKREKVGEIDVEYMDGAGSITVVRTINAQLWKLLVGGYGFKVTKA
jgi:hypothetical protein